MGDRDECIVVEERGGSFSGFLWGALIGAAAMLMLAPRSGEETLRRLSETGRKLRGRAEGRWDDVESTVRDRYGEVRSEVGGHVSAARHAFETGVDTGRRAVRETRDAVRSDYEARRPRSDGESGTSEDVGSGD